MRLAPVEVVHRTIARFWARRGAVTTRTLRLTGAAVAAYLAAVLVLDDPRPVLAPLTALLVVQVTLVGTVADSLRRILSVIAGVAVAVGFSAFVGFSWWSLALIIAVSLLVGQFLRLGAHQLEVPISAMLVLAVGGSETAATDRISATIVGAAVGLAVTWCSRPPCSRSRPARRSRDTPHPAAVWRLAVREEAPQHGLMQAAQHSRQHGLPPAGAGSTRTPEHQIGSGQ